MHMLGSGIFRRALVANAGRIRQYQMHATTSSVANIDSPRFPKLLFCGPKLDDA